MKEIVFALVLHVSSYSDSITIVNYLPSYESCKLAGEMSKEFRNVDYICVPQVVVYGQK